MSSKNVKTGLHWFRNCLWFAENPIGREKTLFGIDLILLSIKSHLVLIFVINDPISLKKKKKVKWDPCDCVQRNKMKLFWNKKDDNNKRYIYFWLQQLFDKSIFFSRLYLLFFPIKLNCLYHVIFGAIKGAKKNFLLNGNVWNKYG